MGELLVDNFMGGINYRDTPNQLLPNESPSAINIALDERGGLGKRKTCETAVSLPGTATTKAYVHYSAALNVFAVARSNGSALRLYTRPGDLSGSWTDRGTINSVATARCAMVDFPGTTPQIVGVTSENSGATEGIFTWDGTTLAFPASGVNIVGDSIALWQNKIWVAGWKVAATANGHPSRVFRCNAGNPGTWGDFTDIRDKDGEGVVGLGVVGGALMAFKLKSAYRITDAATGAYSIADSNNGVVNHRAIVPMKGKLYTWGEDGMYEWDGVGPGKNVGDKILPCYIDPATQQDTICGGAYNDHVLFAGNIARFGSDNAWRLFEYDPQNGWLMEHSMAVGSQQNISFTRKGLVLYVTQQDSDALQKVFTGVPGSEFGSNLGATWRTPWFLPQSGMLARLQMLRVQGLIEMGNTSTFVVTIYRNWTLDDFQQFNVESKLLATDVDQQQLFADLQALGHSPAFSLDIFLGTGDTGEMVCRAFSLIDTQLQNPSPGYPAHQQAPFIRNSGE